MFNEEYYTKRCLNRKRQKTKLFPVFSREDFPNQLWCASLEKKKNQCEHVLDPFFLIVGPLIKKTHPTPVPNVRLSFSIQTACGIVFFTKQLVCVSLEKKRNQYEQVENVSYLGNKASKKNFVKIKFIETD